MGMSRGSKPCICKRCVPEFSSIEGDGATMQPRPNLGDEVASELRDRILSGVFRPGDKLPQDRIAAELGVSKLPVREALIRLEAEGLVTNPPRRGSFVAPIVPEDVVDAYVIYGLVSGHAARRAADRISKADLRRLDLLAGEMEAAEDTEAQSVLNSEFHAIINRAGGSRRLRSALRSFSRTLPTNFFGVRWHWADHAHEDHREIIAALRSKDGERAFQAMFSHLRRSGEHAVVMLEEAGFWAETGPDRPAA